MSENGSGFDWMSVFFIVIAGIASLVQFLVKKKTPTSPTVVSGEEMEEEYQDSSTEEYFPRMRTVEGYSNSDFNGYTQNMESTEVIAGGDYYQAIETRILEREVEDIDTLLHNAPQVEGAESTDFNLRRAIIYSEILKRKY